MTTNRREENVGDDRRWIERVEQTYAPSKLTAAKRARLDAELWSRVAARTPVVRLVPAFAGALAVALVAVLTLANFDSGDRSPSTPQIAAAPSPAMDARAWQYLLELETSPAAVNETQWDENESLPREYEAISDLFLEG